MESGIPGVEGKSGAAPRQTADKPDAQNEAAEQAKAARHDDVCLSLSSGGEGRGEGWLSWEPLEAKPVVFSSMQA
ncbi:hypothetical protein RA280_41615 [Cupriavidus sp. CV2]|uniref:hypothetical protein n=1 Tax=Cupriavidus ulmosensis TaxID=3065913 RepID=UPI00296A9D18|nr:hypothetical protein [Cupriavidus sp. CV2]MDW3688119.1 hypothetical protein [Cupriavidus sp. CV2]